MVKTRKKRAPHLQTFFGGSVKKKSLSFFNPFFSDFGKKEGGKAPGCTDFTLNAFLKRR
jgi:hypothetical protein